MFNHPNLPDKFGLTLLNTLSNLNHFQLIIPGTLENAAEYISDIYSKLTSTELSCTF